MKTTVCHDAAYELALFAENDGNLYRRMSKPIIANLAKRMNKGQYNKADAIKAWEHLAREAAKRYAKIFCSPDVPYYEVFNAATRRETAAMLEESYLYLVEEEAEGDK